MKLTRNHALALGYWRLSPALRDRVKLPAPNINLLINEHSGWQWSHREIGINNALALVALRRKNGDSAREALAPSQWDAVQGRGNRSSAGARYFIMKRWHSRLIERIAA